MYILQPGSLKNTYSPCFIYFRFTLSGQNIDCRSLFNNNGEFSIVKVGLYILSLDLGYPANPTQPNPPEPYITVVLFGPTEFYLVYPFNFHRVTVVVPWIAIRLQQRKFSCVNVNLVHSLTKARESLIHFPALALNI